MTQDQDVNRQQIKDNQWTQGSTLAYLEAGESITCHLEKIEKKGKSTLLVISQSCDVINGNVSDEPFVECMIVMEIKKCHGSCENGLNPRKLHFSYKEKCFEVAAKKVCFLPKQYLIDKACTNTLCAFDDMKGAEWVRLMDKLREFRANRYVRTATPEAFDALARSTFNGEALKAVLERLNRNIERMYIRLEPFGESEQYSVGIIALVSDDSDNEICQSIEVELDTHLLQPLTKIDDIDVENYGDDWEGEGLTTVMKKQDFTLDLLDSFYPYYYDPISMKQS